MIDEDGVRYEVKATCEQSGGSAHISEQELLMGLTSGEGWQLVGVRIPEECVKKLFSVLKNYKKVSKPRKIKIESRMEPAIIRLAQAIGVDVGKLIPHHDLIIETITSLEGLDDDRFIYGNNNQPWSINFRSLIMEIEPSMVFPFRHIDKFPRLSNSGTK